jgi:2-oxoglutarate dehydrogenase E1 component
MRRYQYFLASEHFAPNSMTYIERCYEDQLQGTQNPIGQTLDLSAPNTLHHQICQARHRAQSSAVKQASAEPLIEFYRRYGHYFVDLGLFDVRDHAVEKPSFAGHLEGKLGSQKLTKSVTQWEEILNHIYTQDIAYEFMHCTQQEQAWFIEVIESQAIEVTQEEVKLAYADLVRAVKLEGFLGLNFVGQKRFSLEGCEGLVALIESIIRQQLKQDYDDVVIGMSHRGRINTLVNILGLPLETIVKKFEGNQIPKDYSGDVKYHLGHSVDRVIDGQHIHIALGYNPSHLEAINAVVLGNVRARIDRQASKPYAILVHGDAAVAGQGVVMESLSMSKVAPYDIGGTFHIIVNNQIGFTTNPMEGRTQYYCTDIAKMIKSPVMHIKADNLPAMIKAAKIAQMYQNRSKKDVFIDLVGYRKYGHNEADEPRATQPVMYDQIAKQQPLLQRLQAELKQYNVGHDYIDHIDREISERIKQRGQLIDCVLGKSSSRELAWQQFQSPNWWVDYVKLTDDEIKNAAKLIADIPQSIKLQRQVDKLFKARSLMADNQLPLNWGMAELTAYQLLINHGVSVRLVGQDCVRGTFAHRHAAVYDQETGQKYVCVQSTKQAKFMNYNSILSEYAALGFEYGYAETDPNTLVVFEAQFGDFMNGAQIIIDQFISSGYQKWQRYCGLVMLLPHGYEGQGPEHSSARLERFLQLAAEQSMQICVPSNAAQIFRLLTRQALRAYRRPLVIMSPKSLLRLEAANSSLEDLAKPFSVVIEDQVDDKAEEILICSGKIFYEIKSYATQNHYSQSIIRLEQLYPFPTKDLKAIIAKYKYLKRVKWCQEEPLNQGAWSGIRDNLEEVLGPVQLDVYARPKSASPAVGYLSVHQEQQETLIKSIFKEENK